MPAGGPADGCALSYIAHLYIGSSFSTIYGIVIVAILWFAGASAMTGLLNLIPKYPPTLWMNCSPLVDVYFLSTNWILGRNRPPLRKTTPTIMGLPDKAEIANGDRQHQISSYFRKVYKTAHKEV
nr:hypothetical protein [Corynebacterium diphtheriae]